MTLRQLVALVWPAGLAPAGRRATRGHSRDTCPQAGAATIPSKRALPSHFRVNPSAPAPNISMTLWAAAQLKEIQRLPTARFTDIYPDGAPDRVVEEWTAKR